uniref:hypothetical protein n=1 Tax=Microbispora cellulosiformans TaxID=2614688 RepID=UPI00124456BD|nr:hypothetical protein [Microbispora cellulosiformans]
MRAGEGTGVRRRAAKASKGDFAWFGEQILGVSASWNSPGAVAARCPGGLVRLGYEALVSDRRYSERISHDFGGGVGIGLEALTCSGWRHRPVNPSRPLDPCVTGYADRYLTILTSAPTGTLCSPR